jgi:hypothetical protein
MNARLTNPALRAGLWFLAVVEIAVGVVATVSPRDFYDYVPGSTCCRPIPNT